MKKVFFWGVCILAFALAVSYIVSRTSSQAKETITYFPLNETVQFKSADTTLTLEKEKKNGLHKVDWRVHSFLDQKAFLRQDLGLLFVNGRLKGGLGMWKRNASGLVQEKTISTGESAKYQAISFHYAELHNGDENITSSQTMSSDTLYVIDSPHSPLQSFRNAKSKQEKEWKKTLDQVASSRERKTIEKAVRTHGIQLNKYFFFPLSEIRTYEDQPLPGFTKAETSVIIGKLWEGIYKNYYLGIKKSNGTVIAPYDSTMPIIFISRDKSHLLFVTETKNGESIILIQKIQSPS